MRLWDMVDWAGLIDDAEVRAVPSAGALPSWGGRERVSDALSVAGPASVPAPWDAPTSGTVAVGPPPTSAR